MTTETPMEETKETFEQRTARKLDKDITDKLPNKEEIEKAREYLKRNAGTLAISDNAIQEIHNACLKDKE